MLTSWCQNATFIASLVWATAFFFFFFSLAGGKPNYSLIFCIPAAEKYLPPMIQCKSKHHYESCMIGGPHGTPYSCSKCCF